MAAELRQFSAPAKDKRSLGVTFPISGILPHSGHVGAWQERVSHGRPRFLPFIVKASAKPSPGPWGVQLRPPELPAQPWPLLFSFHFHYLQGHLRQGNWSLMEFHPTSTKTAPRVVSTSSRAPGTTKLWDSTCRAGARRPSVPCWFGEGCVLGAVLPKRESRDRDAVPLQGYLWSWGLYLPLLLLVLLVRPWVDYQHLQPPVGKEEQQVRCVLTTAGKHRSNTHSQVWGQHSFEQVWGVRQYSCTAGALISSPGRHILMHCRTGCP